MDGNPTVLAMEQQLHAGKPALKLPDAGDRSNGVEGLRGHALDVLPLRDREHQPVGAGQRRFDGAQSSRATSTYRGSDAGKEDDFPQRKNRQSQSFGH
jgi:hypothetical protein